MKKLIALVIVAVMLLSMMPMMALAADTKMVYFENNWLWTDVKIHYWGGSSATSWPGAAGTVTGTSDNGNDIYSFEIPVNSTGIIFNGIKNDGSGNRDQTPNIENSAIKTDVLYSMTWNNGNAVATTPYTPPTSGGGNQGGGNQEPATVLSTKRSIPMLQLARALN